MSKERDREQSEDKLINAVGELIAEVGFEGLGVNQVAKHAGFSKNLIYRYFESLDGLIYAYMKKNDFWLNAPMEMPETADIRSYLKAFYRREIVEFRASIALKRLRRWELSTDKEFVVQLRAQREQKGVHFMHMMSQFAKADKAQIQAISALLDAGIVYLAIFEENCQMYNGIDIQSDEGWQQIAQGIDLLVDIMIK
ncbi:TetR/AcrR family transcriptional regulator [Bacteroides reticulotermitis]|uniref:Transcriptional regulator n=2 Tax=Bacteroides reticulotermitis TaxID=1133319 RepID=W4UXV2_9BACE|nr:TetR/AcrR family transcriptional regulator [Bacteroides reticulotermitis]MBB4042423.1 AcrR family transcriptional regulator [Bacteroides reticulotermitis]GAE85662.1 transcriptional regulator [Bacteroides reticulotermitis JCM 10512]